MNKRICKMTYECPTVQIVSVENTDVITASQFVDGGSEIGPWIPVN